jgi:hypothetical protein
MAKPLVESSRWFSLSPLGRILLLDLGHGGVLFAIELDTFIWEKL